ncbi:MAG: metal-sensitive transcriptional regulator [Candidatus Pacebacteria bacterium]|nr:metal-sensitive transcriptional regulator [Candidatus Paceibacterota bacterium]MCD8508198.1 metal-sensitive transcriptional regulator [Candidatus Paceibacterota bacterium]MCD8528170.1 metal-sensitive transcriptional regulator [Candidatus Paceibacterota bacterium]MCD8563439.1 metal-sensitive transcriptional regulator [Candidatus Paceibacterota bacterium]
MKQEIKSKITRRLKLVEGQVRGLQKMVEDEKYCVDIITQSSAVKEALSGIEQLLLENHLSTHVLDHIKHGKEKIAVDEILKVYKLAQRKK